MECSFLNFLHIFNHISVFHNKYLGTFLSDTENIAIKDIGNPFTNPKIFVYFWCRIENSLVCGSMKSGSQVSTFQSDVDAVCSSETLISIYWTHGATDEQDLIWVFTAMKTSCLTLYWVSGLQTPYYNGVVVPDQTQNFWYDFLSHPSCYQKQLPTSCEGLCRP